VICPRRPPGAKGEALTSPLPEGKRMKENAQRSSFNRGVCPRRCIGLHSLITNPAPTRDNTPLTAPLHAPQSVSSSEERYGHPLWERGKGLKENAKRSSFNRGVCPRRCTGLHSLITNPVPTRDNTPLTAPLYASQSVSSSEERR